MSGALQRYCGAVATIQIREIPESAYEVLRRRARGRGQSIQAYMREQVLTMASRPTKEEALDSIEATLERQPTDCLTTPESIVSDLAADRR
ncbi:MAG: FitA-like ribbon-helix-helix domain-containing protein [Solirubrobacteraceae bacterium]